MRCKRPYYRSGKGLALIGAVFAGLAARADAGTVQIVSQTRFVRTVLENIPGESGDLVDMRSAPDAGPFSATSSQEGSGDGFTTRVLARQVSSLDQNRFSFSGNLSYAAQNTLGTEEDGPPFNNVAEATAVAVTVFSVDVPYRYTLTYDLNILDPDTGSFPESALSLFPADNGELPAVPASGKSVSGVLRPGEYTLQFLRSANSVQASSTLHSYNEEYGLTLDLAPVDGANPGPNPIPVPPAVWSGLIVLGAGALNRLRKHAPR